MGFGKAATGSSYPAIYVYGYRNTGTQASPNWVQGVWACSDATAAAGSSGSWTWRHLANSYPDGGVYPDGWYDGIFDLSGDMSNYGVVYYIKGGSGAGYGGFP
jgi:hypothetical protein